MHASATLTDSPSLPNWTARWQATPPLWRFFLLAALLHVLVVLWFGSAPPGSARPGEGRLGAINIVLRGMAGEGDAKSTGQSPAPYSGPKGTAQSQRWGGAPRDAHDPAAALPDPGAGGHWCRSRTMCAMATRWIRSAS